MVDITELWTTIAWYLLSRTMLADEVTLDAAFSSNDALKQSEVKGNASSFITIVVCSWRCNNTNATKGLHFVNPNRYTWFGLWYVH